MDKHPEQKQQKTEMNRIIVSCSQINKINRSLKVTRLDNSLGTSICGWPGLHTEGQSSAMFLFHHEEAKIIHVYEMINALQFFRLDIFNQINHSESSWFLSKERF